MTIQGIRKEPCSHCPYRQDCPSGVWHASEYDKLPAYDGETWEQPLGLFGCHATPEHVCHGWAVVSGEESLALRLHHLVDRIPEAAVPLFATHTDAAEHGRMDLAAPSPEADAAMAKLLRKYPRLREDSTRAPTNKAKDKGRASHDGQRRRQPTRKLDP